MFNYLLFRSIQVNPDCVFACPLSPQVTVVRQEYEKKIKGLMPSELRKELEDTISSLKAQVRAATNRSDTGRPMTTILALISGLLKKKKSWGFRISFSTYKIFQPLTISVIQPFLNTIL